MSWSLSPLGVRKTYIQFSNVSVTWRSSCGFFFSFFFLFFLKLLSWLSWRLPPGRMSQVVDQLHIHTSVLFKGLETHTGLWTSKLARIWSSKEKRLSHQDVHRPKHLVLHVFFNSPKKFHQGSLISSKWKNSQNVWLWSFAKIEGRLTLLLLLLLLFIWKP